MISRPHLWALILLAIGVFVGAIWISGGQVSLGWSAYLSVTITVVVGAIAIFNLWLWRLNFLQGWFVKRPHLWGTWNAAIKTEWIDPVSSERRQSVKATLAIRQTYAALQVRMTSEQSRGELFCANLLAKDDGGFRLTGIYRNEPNLAERARSTIHYGSFLLDIEGPANSPTRMTGHYWTDRDTKGEMIVDERRPV